MAKNTRTFIDIDLNFGKHPVNNDVSRKFDDSAIKQSIRSLILTRNFERPFHSEIGSPITGLLFESVSPGTAQLIKKVIEQTIINFEPRVVLLDVQVKFSPDNNSVYCSIEYRIVNTSTPQTLNLTLKRTR